MRTFQSPDMPVLEVETFCSDDSNEICSTWVTSGSQIHTVKQTHCSLALIFGGMYYSLLTA